jgi:peptide methionine sulfoxide reductase MsrB
MRLAVAIILLGLVACASRPEPCCTGMTGKESNQLSFLHRHDIPEITSVVKSQTKDGFVGQIWWASRTQAIVCVTDGCWEVLLSSDGHWDTGSHWPKLTPEQKTGWLQEQHERIIAP